MTLSLCMIVKNEEEVLSRCLDSIKEIVDEIIIVDTGSIDKTKEIAKLYTSTIYDFVWIDDFSAARNFAFSKATCDYIMWLDADDVIEKEELEKLKILKQTIDNVDVIMLPYHISFDENNKPTFSYFRERILKNDGTFIWHDPVHEAITPHGKIIYENIGICHRKIKATPSKRNLQIYEKLISQNVELSARQKFYYSRELFFNGLYKSAITSFLDYLEKYNGWVENKIEACLNLAECYCATLDYKNALKYLYQSFIFDLPRAEILCKIGEINMILNQYDFAIYWFNLALQCKKKFDSGAFILQEHYDFIPYLQLCVCYFQKNDILKAIYYNKKAAKLKPNSPSILHNKKYFKEWTLHHKANKEKAK